MNQQALIFSNLLNGVPEHQVAEAFRISPEEVRKTFAFVFRKVKSYCFLRQTRKAYPTIIGHTVEDARKVRLTCLSVLPNLNLDKSPEFKDIQTEIMTPDNAMQIARNLA